MKVVINGRLQESLLDNSSIFAARISAFFAYTEAPVGESGNY